MEGVTTATTPPRHPHPSPIYPMLNWLLKYTIISGVAFSCTSTFQDPCSKSKRRFSTLQLKMLHRYIFYSFLLLKIKGNIIVWNMHRLFWYNNALSWLINESVLSYWRTISHPLGFITTIFHHQSAWYHTDETSVFLVPRSIYSFVIKHAVTHWRKMSASIFFMFKDF